MTRPPCEELAVEPEDEAVLSARTAVTAFSTSVSKTGWRSIGERLMTLQDLARGRLLLQRLGQVAVPLLELLEQPDVLDGDDRLVREGLQQLDLVVGERPRLGARPLR